MIKDKGHVRKGTMIKIIESKGGRRDKRRSKVWV